MRIWNKLRRNLIGGFVFLKGKSSASEDPAKMMNELENRLRKSNDALNKIISES
jgi:hypothetical protein